MNRHTTAEVYIRSALFFAAYTCCREILGGDLSIRFGVEFHSLAARDVENEV